MINFEVMSLLLAANGNLANTGDKADDNAEAEEYSLDDEAQLSVETSIYHRQAVPQARSRPGRIKTPKPFLISPKIQGKAFQPKFKEALNSFLTLASHRPSLSRLLKTILNKLSIKDMIQLKKLMFKLHRKAQHAGYKFLSNHGLKYAIRGLYLALSLQMPEYIADAFRIVRTEQNLNKYFVNTTSYYQRP